MIDATSISNIERVSEKGKNTFFGYYDISPESPDGTKVLVSHPPFIDRMPTTEDKLEIGYIENCEEFVRIGTTKAWNFQEGCRLQWIDDDRVAYNVMQEGAIGSEIYSISDHKVIHTYNYPLYSINRKSNTAIAYNMYRSRYCYAHTGKEETTDYAKDGIYILDLETGERRLLVSIKELSKETKTSANNNWVEHAVFNPKGDRFFFFHRWTLDRGGFITRLCVSDLDGNVKTLLNSGMCSHAGWINNDKLSAWARMPRGGGVSSVGGALKRTEGWRIAVELYHKLIKNPKVQQRITNDAYILFDLRNDKVDKINNADFIRDGHETWSRDSRWMVTDSYPDKKNMRSLMLYDSEKDNVYLLGKFYSYPEINSNSYINIPGIRCDLHPKWSYQEKYIYFDSTHEGYRGLYKVDISRIKT